MQNLQDDDYNGYGDYDDYDDEPDYDVYEGYDGYIPEPTPAQRIKYNLGRWKWNLIHRVKMIVSKHYREHYDDIPF